VVTLFKDSVLLTKLKYVDKANYKRTISTLIK